MDGSQNVIGNRATIGMLLDKGVDYIETKHANKIRVHVCKDNWDENVANEEAENEVITRRLIIYICRSGGVQDGMHLEHRPKCDTRE